MCRLSTVVAALPMVLATAALPLNAAEARIEEGLRDLGGVALFVKTVGEGEPIVLVHGGPGFDHSYFLPGMAELADDFRLVFFDQRVSGRSPADLEPEQITLSRFVGDIEALRRFLGVKRIHLLGHSFGGLLAMHYAVSHPERLRSLMLVNSTAASSEYVDEVNRLLQERLSEEDRQRRRELAQSEALERGEPAAIRELLGIVLSANFHDPGKATDLELYVGGDFAARSQKLQNLASDLAEFDLYPRLGEIRAPTLIVRGRAEVLPREATERIHAAIPGSRLAELEDCGHFPFGECNDRLQSVLRAFLGSL